MSQFDVLPDERMVAATVAALESHGFTVEVVDDLASARRAVLARIPHGARVWRNTSVTVEEAGISAEIDAADGRYESVRLRMSAQDFASRQMKEIAAAPDRRCASDWLQGRTRPVIVARMRSLQHVRGSSRQFASPWRGVWLRSPLAPPSWRVPVQRLLRCFFAPGPTHGRPVDRHPSESARARRAAAAQICRDFASAADLVTLLGVAEHGLAGLFGGQCTIQLGADADTNLIAGNQPVLALSAGVATGLSGDPSPDVTSNRPGILLVPQCTSRTCRAWVEFPTPRPIGVDGMIVADLFAQGFALAVDRLVSEGLATEREDRLEHAVEGHQIIGQATGILVESRRITSAEAFELLKVASQNRPGDDRGHQCDQRDHDLAEDEPPQGLGRKSPTLMRQC